MRYPLLICLTSALLIYSCNDGRKDKGKESIIQAPSSLSDSVKWLYYAIHYGQVAFFYDTMQNKRINVPVVDCELTLAESFKRSDTMFYLFSFVKPGANFLYVENTGYIRGIGESKGSLFPINHGVQFESEKNKDSTRSFF